MREEKTDRLPGSVYVKSVGYARRCQRSPCFSQATLSSTYDDPLAGPIGVDAMDLAMGF